MLKYLLFVVSVLCVGGAYAQQNIIESLQTRRAGEGVVTIHQDAQITSLIGKRYVRSTSSEPHLRSLHRPNRHPHSAPHHLRRHGGCSDGRGAGNVENSNH